MAKVLGVLVAALVAWALTATAAVAEGRWQALGNNPSCVVWNDYGWRHHLFFLLNNTNSV